MTDLRIHKLTFSPVSILQMTDDRRSAFLLLGLFLNEVNWLQKLLIMGMPDERIDPEPVMQSNLSLAILLTKLLAGKIHAGGERFRDQPLRSLLANLRLSRRGVELKNRLDTILQSNSTIHRVRINSAHYPQNLNLMEPLPGQEELAVYLTPNVGDVFMHLSDLAAIEALVPAPINSQDELLASLDQMIREVVDAAGVYTEFIAEIIRVLIDEMPENSIQEEILLANAEPLDAVRPKFFAFPVSENYSV
jgi:hypothetical protein